MRQLIEDYLNGETWSNLCKKYNCSTYRIHKILKDANIPKTRMMATSWTAEKRNNFKQEYLSGCSYKELSIKFSCSEPVISYWAHKLQLPMRGSGKWTPTENKFLLNTPESEYWLGYLLADGHISTKGHYSVFLFSKEKYVVEEYKKWYDNIPKIYKRFYKISTGETRIMYIAYLGNKSLVKWFVKELKIQSKKHHTLNPNKPITWDLLRGYFDGDGTSAKNAFTITSCSKTWLLRIQEFLNKYDIFNIRINEYETGCKLSVYRKEDLHKLVPLLYENKYFCHKYKFKKLEPYISNDI